MLPRPSSSSSSSLLRPLARAFTSSPPLAVSRRTPSWFRPSASQPSPPVEEIDTRSYPSPINSEARRYLKPQRDKWHGPESDVPDDGALGSKRELELATMWPEESHPLTKEARERGPSPWFVSRTTKGGFLPVYTEFKSNREQVFTIVRRIEGDSNALLTPLLHFVALARPDFPRGIEGRVNRLTGHVVLKGNWKTEVKQFLFEKGM